MKNNTYNALRLFAGLLTIVIIVSHQYIPKKVITLLPNADYPYFIHGPQDVVGSMTARWIDEGKRHWQCTFLPQHSYACGFSINISPEDHTTGLDLSSYDGLNVKVKYSGDAQRIRIYVRNFDVSYGRGDPTESAKFQSAIIRAQDLHQSIFVQLTEFRVAEWWINEFDVSREHAAPDFTNVTSVGFDFINHGQHTLEIEQVELVGSRIQKETLYIATLAFWMVLIFWEGIHRFYLVYRESRIANQKISELKTDYELLEQEKSNFESLSTKDALTGVLNRTGIQRNLGSTFQPENENNRVGLLIFDIDHFKRINDSRGHDSGDRILKDFAELISANIREQDVFGRWGGEEFILVCFQKNKDQLLALAEKLRSVVAEHVFEPDNPRNVTVSLGATMIQHDDTFETAFKRADLALYDAKSQGRNCVVFNNDRKSM